MIQRFCLALERSGIDQALLEVRPDARPEFRHQLEGWLGAQFSLQEARASRPRIAVASQGPADVVVTLNVTGARLPQGATFVENAELSCKAVRRQDRWWIAAARLTEVP
jgi:hypothetical protein